MYCRSEGGSASAALARRFGLLSVAALGALSACAEDSAERGTSSAADPATPTITTTAVTSGMDGPSMPTAVTGGSGESSRDDTIVPEGFTLVVIEVTRPDGTTEEICVWLADSADERQRGLMGVTDLGEADGMLFAYEMASDGRFWMYDTPMPLSIAFFDESGSFVSATDMEPCLDSSTAECRRYSAGGSYTHAVEAPIGRLPDLGIEPRSQLHVRDSELSSCPAS